MTGGAGLVGGRLLASIPDEVEVAATWRTTPVTAGLDRGVQLRRLDLRDEAATREAVAATAADVVVHTAYSMGSRDDIVAATASVAAAAAGTGAALVHLSTDVVFDGESAPYLESDPVAPVNDYGRWKLEAERAAADAVPDVCITRTSLVVDLALPDRSTAALLDTVRGGGAPTLFVDEVRSPIRAVDLADTLWALLGLDRSPRAGVWHLPGPEALSRWELGTRLLAAAGLQPSSVVAVSARDHPDPRPADLTLHTERDTPGPAPLPVDDTTERRRV